MHRLLFCGRSLRVSSSSTPIFLVSERHPPLLSHSRQAFLSSLYPPSEPAASDKATITEITEYLYDKGIDFSDCPDARSLRARYAAVREGSYVNPKQAKKRTELGSLREQHMPSSVASSASAASSVPLTGGSLPSSGRCYSSEYDGTAITPDPYPTMPRYAVAPWKYIWEVKEELCRQQGYEPSQMELLAGDKVLEDFRKVLDYPDLQRGAPVQMRSRARR